MSNDTSKGPEDLTVMSREPLIAGTPLGSMKDLETLAANFFVRNHFPIPRLESSGWSLKVTGEVERPFSLGLDALKEMPRREVLVLMECAGNSRGSVQPPIEGLLWDNGAVGTARWTGVPLRSVLEYAGLLDSAVEVLLEGADRGNQQGTTGEMGNSMSLPMDKALHPDTLLTYDMNGESLSPEHGYPLRAVVPGWFGMTAVKWLTGIQVLSQPFWGFHQNDYCDLARQGSDSDNWPPRDPRYGMVRAGAGNQG